MQRGLVADGLPLAFNSWRLTSIHVGAARSIRVRAVGGGIVEFFFFLRAL
jgi:hypothetical protein